MMRMAALDERKQTIRDALAEAMARQKMAGAEEFDLVALAVAIDQALGGDGIMPGEPFDDGKEPDELNAANDG